MIIKQLSVFIENKQGRLANVLNALAQNSIDVSALSLADTSDFGVLRLIVDQPEKGKQVLTDSGVAVKITDVVAVVMDDAPGGAASAIAALSEGGIAVEYMYACIGRVNGKALMVMRVENIAQAEEILEKNGYAVHNPEDVYRI